MATTHFNDVTYDVDQNTVIRIRRTGQEVGEDGLSLTEGPAQNQPFSRDFDVIL